MLIVEMKIAFSELGVPWPMSILPAGVVKKCFDLGIPCYVHFAGARTADGETVATTLYEHLDKIERIESEGVTTYEFTFGNTSLNADSLDEPIGSGRGPIG